MHSTKDPFFYISTFIAGLFLVRSCIKTLPSGKNIGISGLFETNA